MSLFVVRIAYRLFDRGMASHTATSVAVVTDGGEEALELALALLPDREMAYAANVVDHGDKTAIFVDFPQTVSRAEVQKDRWRVLANDIGGGY